MYIYFSYLVLKVILRLLKQQPRKTGIACREMERIELQIFKILPWVDCVSSNSVKSSVISKLSYSYVLPDATTWYCSRTHSADAIVEGSPS